jgi:WD40 repeat protein
MADGAGVRSLVGHTFWIGELAYSPDGVYLASGSGDGTVKVWRTSNGSLAYTISNLVQAPPIAFSPDSATLAIGVGSEIQLRGVADGSLKGSWVATPGLVAALAFSPDGTLLASGAGARGRDTALKTWQVPDGTLRWSVPTAQAYSIGVVAFSRDGRLVLTGSDYLYSGPMQAWRSSDGALVTTFPESVYSLAFSADGTMLVSVGTNITFWSAADGRVVKRYPDGPYAGPNQGPKGIAMTPDGYRFARSRGFGEVLVGTVPVWIHSAARQNGQLVLRWVGGTGRYQLQRTSAFPADWHDEGGILTTNAAVVPTGASKSFYRVVSLPQ